MLEVGFAIALVMATMNRPLEGTLMKVEDVKPARLVVNVSRQFQTFTVAARPVIERESTCAGQAKTARIDVADLTPGEYVRLELDRQGRVTHARAIARVERAKVGSVNGSTVVLEDGTALTIGSVLRFVDSRGKVSATPTVRPGESVLLFRHPQTRNIYRLAAESRRAKKHAGLPKS